MIESGHEALLQIEAKIGGSSKRREILYSFVETFDSFYMKKTEIYKAQIQACRNLSKLIGSNEEAQILDNEIVQLQLSLGNQSLEASSTS